MAPVWPPSSWSVIIQNVGRQTCPGCCALLGLGRGHGHAECLMRESLLHRGFVPSRALHPGAMLGPRWDQAKLLWANHPPAPVSSLQENLQLQSRACEPVTWSSCWWLPLPWWRGQLPFSSCVTRERPENTTSKPSPTTSATRCSTNKEPGCPQVGEEGGPSRLMHQSCLCRRGCRHSASRGVWQRVDLWVSTAHACDTVIYNQKYILGLRPLLLAQSS